MGIDVRELRVHVIRPALVMMCAWSISAEDLLIGTCCQESGMGKYLHQVGGPALGIYQMEPRTHDDIWKNLIERKNYDYMAQYSNDPNRLVYDLRYATIMTRLHYMRFPEPLPSSTDIEGLAGYWKKYYNTDLGHGTVEQFLDNYDYYNGV